MSQFPKPGALLSVDDPQVEEGADGSAGPQGRCCGKVGARNHESPSFKLQKVDSRKEGESAGEEEVGGPAPC